MPIPIRVIPINRSTIREEVYNTLLNWITEGKLHPGEKLLDKEVAKNLGVSRTPVREAFRRLEDKGLLETSAGCWTRVSPMSLNEADRIYPIICKLEELVISLCINKLTDADFNQLDQANKTLASAIKVNQPIKASQADYRFHEILIEKSNNPDLINILKDLKIKFRRLEVYYFRGCISAADSVHEHEQLLGALRDRNSESAQKMIRLNWENSMKRIRATSDLQ
jgi:DNA-binding GntR family transcriptional regulator